MLPVQPTVCSNQMHRIKSHDCTGMKGMQINDCACMLVPDIALGTKWNVNLFALLIHTHQKYMMSCIPQRHRRLSRLLSACMKGGWGQDYTVFWDIWYFILIGPYAEKLFYNVTHTPYGGTSYAWAADGFYRFQWNTADKWNKALLSIHPKELLEKRQKNLGNLEYSLSTKCNL